MKEIVIVLVDANEIYLKTIKDFVESISKNFKCTAFSNPGDALQYVIEKKEIHVVISDYKMSQMNGLTLANRIIEALPERKVIVMSEHDTNYLKRYTLKFEIDENIFRL